MKRQREGEERNTYQQRYNSQPQSKYQKHHHESEHRQHPRQHNRDNRANSNYENSFFVKKYKSQQWQQSNLQPGVYKQYVARPIANYSFNFDTKDCKFPGAADTFCRVPKVGTNLMKGYPEQYVPKDGKAITETSQKNLYEILCKHMPEILQSASSAPLKTSSSATSGNQEPEGSTKQIQFDFISFRNNFNKIMYTPYNWNEPWLISLVRVGNTVIFNTIQLDHESNSTRASAAQATGTTSTAATPTSTQPESSLNFDYMAFNYEHLCTIPESEEDKPTTITRSSEFASLASCKMGSFNLLLGAEIDCIDESGVVESLYTAQKQGATDAPATDSTSTAPKYVELKTTKEPSNPKAVSNFHRYKTIKMWIQSMLAAVPHVIIGFRDDNGVLQRNQVVPTPEFISMAKEQLGDRSWNPDVCYTFATDLMAFIKQKVKPMTFYLLDYKHPFTNVLLTVTNDKQNHFLTQEQLKTLEQYFS